MSGIQTLRKQPTETRNYEMKFDALLDASETIASITSVTPVPATGITLVGAAAISTNGKSVIQKISGGTLGVSYKITIIVVTTPGGFILEGDGRLAIVDE